MPHRGLFISGTSTEVGKTHVAAMIARQLVNEGHRVGVYKPAASGCQHRDGQLIAEDAVALWKAAGKPGALDRVCPQRFLAPLAPPLAAAAEGKAVDEKLLVAGVEYWRLISDIVLVEGAGGLMSPLSQEEYNIDVAADLGYPLVIVAPNELGVINQALQTVITARARAPRLPIAGIVLNQAADRPNDASLGANAAELAARCNVPLLASMARGDHQFAPGINWFALAIL